MFDIHPDIRKASTLPARFYQSDDVFQQLIDLVFKSNWHFIGDINLVPELNYAHPFILLPNSINEPLILTRNKQGILNCLSNVCTHRGMILIEKPGPVRVLSCSYHGRCFSLEGQFRSMPSFNDAEHFPSDEDHLNHISLHQWESLLFANISPTLSFEEIFNPIIRRMQWYDIHNLIFSEKDSHTYHINAHWALYCDNYLEGFHVPFVHPGLNEHLDQKEYDTELYPYASLQLGVASPGSPSFQSIPEDSPYAGKDIFAFYWWVFPNLMLNFYTWGLSVNVVEPIDRNHTRVHFKTYLFNDKRAVDFSKEDIHQTELEDEVVVERVHQGLKSQFYTRGRFSPTKETGVHHFHRLLANALSD